MLYIHERFELPQQMGRRVVAAAVAACTRPVGVGERGRRGRAWLCKDSMVRILRGGIWLVAHMNVT